MREIKFRGKSNIDGKWFYGNLFDNDSFGRTQICALYNGCFDINPSTVGQYTGLKDKDGKDIYEGDILLDNWLGEPEIMLCKWANGDGCFRFILKEYCDNDTDGPFLEWQDLNEPKVIGNLYDNPELLEDLK